MDKVNNNKSPHLKGKLKKKPNRTKTQYRNLNLIREHSTVLSLCNLDRVRAGLGSNPTGPDKIGLANEETELARKFDFFFFFVDKLKIWVDLPIKSITYIWLSGLCVYFYFFTSNLFWEFFFWVVNYVFGALFLHYFAICFLTFQIF